MKTINRFYNFLQKNIIGISSFFIVFPVLIFIISNLKIYFSIPISLVIILLYFSLLKNEKNNDYIDVEITKKEILRILLKILIISIWVYFSGIGNFSYQNDDFDVRNAVLRDLINFKWPVYYNLSTSLSKIVGTKTVGLVYYYTYWIPSALIGKIFGINIANIFLFIYSILNISLILTLIEKKLKSNSYKILLIFILFSGLDMVGIGAKYAITTNFLHIERWNLYFQYSSNTTLLYWVFNQAIPSWLITMIILNCKNSKTILYIAPLIFCYSPFATFGMIPIAIYLYIKKIIEEKKKLKNVIFNLYNLIPIIVAIIFGLYYISADSSINNQGFYIPKIGFWIFLIYYLSFIFIEVIPYLIILKENKKDKLYLICILELLLIPFYYMTKANDFCMRGSIVPLFIVCLYTIKFILNNNNNKILKHFLTIIIILGSVTSLNEIGRSVKMTITTSKKDYIKDKKIYSISNPITEYGQKLCNEQFYYKGTKSLYFNYLAKENKK